MMIYFLRELDVDVSEEALLGEEGRKTSEERKNSLNDIKKSLTEQRHRHQSCVVIVDHVLGI